MLGIERIEFSFPAANIIGYWFHFGQCLFRTLTSFVLKSQYGTDSELKKIFDFCVAMTLSSETVNDVFADVIIDNSVNIIRKYPPFEKFLYDARFSIPLWNHWCHMTLKMY